MSASDAVTELLRRSAGKQRPRATFAVDGVVDPSSALADHARRPLESIVEEQVLARAVSLHHALLGAGVENAFGGALGLICHLDAQPDVADLDLHLGLHPGEAERALRALPEEIAWDEASVATADRDAAVHLTWPLPDGRGLPITLVFRGHGFGDVLTRALSVPALGTRIAVLPATDQADTQDI